MNPSFPTRRAILGGAVAAGATAVLPPLTALGGGKESTVLKGRINHSVAFWCFNAAGEKWSLDKTCEVAKSLGIKSVELIGPDTFPTLKKHGLTCALAANNTPTEPFKYGFVNKKYHEELLTRTKGVIDKCAEFGMPSVIGFFGYRWRDPNDPKSGEIPREEAVTNCVAALKDLAQYAEAKQVTVNVEHLNSRDDTHPMKGHPGYMGDDLGFCTEILRKVGSPRIRLLFDIYHVQIMHGDVIRRLGECQDLIGHVHTAGNPGRCELDENQELNYPPILKALAATGYKGFVGHEFIPTRDPYAGLKQAVEVCDV